MEKCSAFFEKFHYVLNYPISLDASLVDSVALSKVGDDLSEFSN